MSRHRAVPAGSAVIAFAMITLAVITLAGCGTPSSSSPATSASSPAAATSRGAGTANGTATTVATPGAKSSSNASSGSIPFPAAVGNTWIYQAVTSIDNAHAIDTRKVLSVTRATAATQVTMSDTLSPGTEATTEDYIFYDNGQIGFPVQVPHGVSVVSGNGVVWPDSAGLASGRAYHSVLRIRLSNGHEGTANVTVQGDGTQPVTVPAGIYQATLVTMVMTTNVGNFATTAVVKVWLAPGTGPVKSGETVEAGGNTQLVSTEELLSFTKGGGRQDGS